MNDRNEKDRRGEPLPGPAEESDTGTIGSTDEESSENRREGLEKDRERARRPSDVGGGKQER